MNKSEEGIDLVRLIKTFSNCDNVKILARNDCELPISMETSKIYKVEIYCVPREEKENADTSVDRD